MSFDWGCIRQQLGPEYAYACGHWFCVPHRDVHRRDGRLFSKKPEGRTDRAGRRVVLATAYGPNASLFARSASVVSRYEHPPHSHPEEQSRCKLDAVGWLDFRVIVSVPATSLNDNTYSCEEPPSSDLRSYLEQALGL